MKQEKKIRNKEKKINREIIQQKERQYNEN